jgi:hypothetical protein
MNLRHSCISGTIGIILPSPAMKRKKRQEGNVRDVYGIAERKEKLLE